MSYRKGAPKAVKALELARARHRAYADYRLELLGGVDEYRNDRDALSGRLKAAVKQMARPIREDQLVPHPWPVNKKGRVVGDKSCAEASATVTPSGPLPPEEQGIVTVQRRLEDLYREELALFTSGGKIPAKKKRKAQQAKVRQQIAAHREALRRLTYWMAPHGASDVETALVCHPSLADFERKWSVIVEFLIHGNGKLEILDVYDDMFPVAIRWFSLDEVLRVTRRLYRRENTHLLIDRRAAFDQIRSTLAPLMDKKSRFKKDPLRLPEERDPWPTETRRKLKPFRRDTDRLIVQLCANATRPPYSKIAREIEPQLAQERFPGQSTKSKRSRQPEKNADISYDWETLRQRIKDHWSRSLKPLVTPQPANPQP